MFTSMNVQKLGHDVSFSFHMELMAGVIWACKDVFANFVEVEINGSSQVR